MFQVRLRRVTAHQPGGVQRRLIPCQSRRVSFSSSHSKLLFPLPRAMRSYACDDATQWLLHTPYSRRSAHSPPCPPQPRPSERSSILTHANAQSRAQRLCCHFLARAPCSNKGCVPTFAASTIPAGLAHASHESRHARNRQEQDSQSRGGQAPQGFPVNTGQTGQLEHGQRRHL